LLFPSTMKRFLPLLLVLVLPACAPGVDGGEGFGRVASTPDGSNDDVVDGSNDPNEDVNDDGDATDNDPPGDDDDDDDTPDLGWEPMPLDAEVGAMWVGTFSCGMLDGEADIWMEMTADGWMQVGYQGDHPAADVVGQTYGTPYPELVGVCYSEGDRDPSVVWEDDGSFHFFNGNWDHHLRPTGLEGRWLGEVTPMFNPSEDCRDALDDLDLDIPVILNLVHAGTWE